jgi:hypothetical protein
MSRATKAPPKRGRSGFIDRGLEPRKVGEFYGFYFLSNEEAEPELRTRASPVARQVRECV